MDTYSREPGRYRYRPPGSVFAVRLPFLTASLVCRLMVSESYDQQEVEKTMMYYSTPLVKESDFPFNFYLLDLPRNHSGLWLRSLVDLWMANMPAGQWANWVVRPKQEVELFD